MNHDRDSNQNCQEAGCGSADCNLYKFKERAAYDWAVETTVYVREGQQRTGIGRKLYEMLEKLLALQNIQNLNACIAYLETENEFLTHNSIRFHEHMGYRRVGEFYQCGYKSGHWYNMVWMEKHIGGHEENPPSVSAFREVRKLAAEKYQLRDIL